MSSDSVSLDQLRRKIDRIDDQLHDLLMERAGLVEQIAGAKAPGGVALRPAREAQVLRRLVGRHNGKFPKAALVRIWREIMGALVGMQAPFSMAVYQPKRGAGYLELARNHFGVVWPQVTHLTPGHVVRMVADGQASVGVVPLPSPADLEPWWLALTSAAENLPRVVARLPIQVQETAAGRPEPLEAFVVACRDPEATGDDRTLVAVETAPDVSRDRLRAAFAAANLDLAAVTATHRSDGVWRHLVELSGHVVGDDPRLAELEQAKDPVTHVSVIGGYAVQLSA
ncbi:MAG TPA: chorismate mutase [Magnetospirillum sp.]|jgi:chorismate mutase-like protein|nr:chorismate mutase [Magnetospirillum sp.]